MMQANTRREEHVRPAGGFRCPVCGHDGGSLWLAALALAPGGFGVLDLAALVLFAVTLPWMVAGFWNAVIGFIIMRFSADPAAAVLPAAGADPGRRARDGVDGDPVVRS